MKNIKRDYNYLHIISLNKTLYKEIPNTEPSLLITLFISDM